MNAEKVYTPEEQKANRKLWADALRSGEYPQGEGTLFYDGAYCCLGVACSVLVGDDWSFDEEEETGWPAGYPRQQNGFMPDAIAAAFGIVNDRVFGWINDSLRIPFAEIADIVLDETDILLASAEDEPVETLYQILEARRVPAKSEV